MPETAYCYHCGAHRPLEEMREILTKGGNRWRRIKSIGLGKQGRAEREPFGQRTTANNKADTQAKIFRAANSERNQHS